MHQDPPRLEGPLARDEPTLTTRKKQGEAKLEIQVKAPAVTYLITLHRVWAWVNGVGTFCTCSGIEQSRKAGASDSDVDAKRSLLRIAVSFALQQCNGRVQLVTFSYQKSND